jgi:SpoIID/LytB domain protein
VELTAVNSLRLHDEYLYGISEVSSAWPMAAMQAQVLAARTYAISKVLRGVRTACACHLDDGGGPFFDQTFTGFAKASAPKGDQWIAAVNGTAASETTGQAILYGGTPISAFYNASSGGITQSSKEVWGKDLPYAQAVADPYMQVPENSVRAWSVAVPQARMASAFGIPAVAKVVVAERFPSGAPKTIVATTPDGATVTRSGGALQSSLALKSSYITTIDGNIGVPLPAVDPATAPGAPAPDAPADPSAVPADPNAAPADGASVDVQQRTVSLLTPTTITAGKKKYKVAGVVRPSKAGLKVWRQMLVKKKWQTVEKTVTNAKGHYRFQVTAKSSPPGTYRVLVVKKRAVVGVSPEYTVTR